MNVKELKEILEKIPDDVEIIVRSNATGDRPAKLWLSFRGAYCDYTYAKENIVDFSKVTYIYIDRV